MEQTEKEKVAIVKFDGTLTSVTSALDLCEGLDGLKPADKVLLKPNILWGGMKNMPPYGRVTTSTIVEHILQCLRDKGCTDITVAEGSIPNREMNSTTSRGFQWTGIARVAKRYGARLLDFNSGPREQIELDDVKVRVARGILECDFLIDIPVLKTHLQTKISLGMKNLKGCLAINSKKAFHSHDLHRLIALLNTKIRPSLTVIDGIYALEKGPAFLGVPHRMDLIVAGKDVFSCDVVGAAIMGFNPGEIEFLREYGDMTGRKISLEGIEIKGEPLEKVTKKFEWRLSLEEVFRRYGIEGLSIQQQGYSCCSGCVALLEALTAILTKDFPGMPLPGVEFCIGRGIRAKAKSTKVLLIGDCALSANRDLNDAVKIGGCPPSIRGTVMAVARECLPRHKAAGFLLSRTIKNVGMKLGVYSEVYPAFGICKPPEFDRKHFR
jgi:uncharacterized protein (DUF362 family)